MKITDVKATLHKIPIEAPLLKEKIWTPIVFTTVETDQDVTGYGLTRAAQRHGAKEFINREVAPFLRGKNPLETERVWQQLYKQFNPRGQTGMWSSAVSAIDIALWDIKGKHYQEPVWRLLGGAQNPVPAYVTFGLRNYNAEQLTEVAKQFVADGQDKLKMVVAVEPENPRTDAERVRAVREAVGEKIELMIDANYLFSFNRALELMPGYYETRYALATAHARLGHTAEAARQLDMFERARREALEQSRRDFASEAEREEAVRRGLANQSGSAR